MSDRQTSGSVEYRLSDAREAEKAIREQLRHRYSEQLHRRNEAHVVEVRKLKDENQALRKAVSVPPSHRIERALKRRLKAAAGAMGSKQIANARPAAKSVESAVVSVKKEPIRRPKFSVIMPIFNNGSCILHAVESIRRQTLTDVEIVIWNDGSTDQETLDILESINDPNVRKFSAPNQGVIGARNSAVAESTGEFLVCLDPDDLIEPTYLEKALITFARYPRVDLVLPVTRFVDADGIEREWIPAPFNERNLAYHNAAPIATAMRRRVWEEVGGLADHMADGFEDWAFWRAVAAKGFRGVVLDEPLFRYTFSEDTGRDSAARMKKDELERIVKTLHPTITPGHPVKPGRQESVAKLLRRQVFHVPNAQTRTIIVFVPWMLRGGGAENFLLTLLPELGRDHQLVVIATEFPPDGFDTCMGQFFDITPYVYDTARLVRAADKSALVHSLLQRYENPIIVNVGSPWAFRHMARIAQWPRGGSAVVDIHFNHIGHVYELLEAQQSVDLVVTAHDHLKSLLADYFEIDPPVETLYISPPRLLPLPEGHGEVENDTLTVGWLGRNSPEKRLDIVFSLAQLAPNINFRVAGGGMQKLPPEFSNVPNVEIVGWVARATEFINTCDLLINTSDVEGISLSAMEALFLGVPVLTRDVGGMSELVSDGVNGLVYDAEDLQDLARRLSDQQLVDAIRQRVAIERLPTEFHEDQMIRSFRRYLQKAGEKLK